MTGLLIGVIWLLIYILIAAAIVYLVIYVLGVVCVSLPPKVVQIFWVIFALIVLLLVIQLLLSAGGMRLPGAVGLSLLASLT